MVTQIPSRDRAASGRNIVPDLFHSVFGLPEKLLVTAFDRLAQWHDRARERHQLRMLDDHMLHDVGLSRSDVESEARKPFWLP